MSAGDRFERCLVGFVADALVLDHETEEGLGAEVSLAIRDEPPTGLGLD